MKITNFWGELLLDVMAITTSLLQEGSASEEWRNKYGGDHVKVGIPSGANNSSQPEN